MNGGKILVNGRVIGYVREWKPLKVGSIESIESFIEIEQNTAQCLPGKSGVTWKVKREESNDDD